MSELMWAGSLSHNGLTGLGCQEDFAVHQLGHELSAMFDTAHGASLATVWDSWALAVMDAKPSRFARYAKNVWGISGSDEKELALAGNQRVFFFSGNARGIPGKSGYWRTGGSCHPRTGQPLFLSENTNYRNLPSA